MSGGSPSGGTLRSAAYLPADRSVPLAELTVAQLLIQRAGECPDHPAVVGTRHGSGETARLTYAQLLAEASVVARQLSELAEPGSFVALWAPNVVEWPVVQYGAALAGVVLVALNPVLRDEELDYALRHSGAGVLLHADRSREYDMAEVARRCCADVPGLRRISLSELTSWCTEHVEKPAELPATVATPDDVAMLQYTSGTTGKPKGVVLKHRSLVNVAKLTMEAAAARPGAVCLNPLPMFHTAGCVIATLGPLWSAGTVHLVERFAPEPVLAQLITEQVDLLFYVPAVLSALLAQQRQSCVPAPKLSTIMGGAANVEAELIDGAAQMFGATVMNLFGQTELAPVLSATRPTDARADRLNTVGRPLPHVDCKIIDPETGQTLGIGEPGEICARGYQQFVEYLHDPGATAAALDAEGYVRTGDLGAMDARGFLTVTGRLKDLIIRGGENIAPLDVELALIAHPQVSAVSVVGLPDPKLGEIVAAVLQCTRSGGPDRDSLLEYARDRLAPYKIPSRWYLAGEFPTTPTGKVQRFALRDAILAGELQEI